MHPSHYIDTDSGRCADCDSRPGRYTIHPCPMNLHLWGFDDYEALGLNPGETDWRQAMTAIEATVALIPSPIPTTPF